MIRARVLGLACGAILAASVASMTGCSSAASAAPGTTAETVRSSNVALSVRDGSGTEIGSGSGILIAPKLVLTAAHLVAGQSSWVIRTADGKVSHGVRGMTYDWLVYNNDDARPALNDVAVIYLDEAINLPAYPHVSTAALAAGASATRVHGQGTLFTNVDAKLGTIAAFPHSYLTDIPAMEPLDTGDAVLDDHNDIIGVVTGRGITSGKLYIARTDSVSSWVTDGSDTCDADGPPPTAPSPPPVTTSSSSSSNGDIGVKTYTPPSGDDDDDNANTSSSSSGYTSSSSSGSPSTSSSSSSGSSSSSSGSPTNCTPTPPGGNCYGASCGTSSSSSSSSSGSPITSSSSSSGSSSSSSGSSSSSSGSDSSPPAGGSNPITPPGTPASGSSTSSSGGASSSSSGGACIGPACDGSPDDEIDYGACPACGGGDVVVK